MCSAAEQMKKVSAQGRCRRNLKSRKLAKYKRGTGVK